MADLKRDRSDRIARGALALVALALLAWLVVMARDARLESRGTRAAGRGDVVRGTRDLRAAGFLNPDTAPDRVRAPVHLGRGDRERAAAILEDVIRREPDNVLAWRNLVLVARGYDAAAVRRAEAAIRRLDPVNARAAPAPRR